MKVVIVESPAKAKTINTYLGKDYIVLPSIGHIRDLPSKDGSVNVDKDFAMTWELSSRANKTISEMVSALKKADTLYLATDPDREGEAISWHIYEVLNQKKALPKNVKRIVFHEITKKAINEAIEHPRNLDYNLIDAYLARRALDYLMGFTLSPILWRKLPGSRSAGRVQSVALRLVVEREEEIESFNSQEYWTIEALCEGEKKNPFQAKLVRLNGKKLEKFSIPTEASAHDALKQIEAGSPYHVVKIEKKTVSRHPSSPFTTSTLQQEAARKLGFSASHTMRTAQSLYEGVTIKGETFGLITYMRTDSVQLSKDAISSIRGLIEKEFGMNYIPPAPRLYKTKVRNAQEAHEAIRPTDLSRTPETLKSFLNADELKLYTLIWKRTIASQMTSALYNQLSVDIANQPKDIFLKALGSTLTFDGFLKVYEESVDEEESDLKSDDASKKQRLLPPLLEGEEINLKKITPLQHFTQPPPRFTEASLVKHLEDLGIGRPSTYASILQVIRDRNYVRLEKKQFIPEERGRIVTVFLENYFPNYVEYMFTANLENNLDEISEGHLAWKKLLLEFWTNLKHAANETKELRISEVLDLLDEKLAHHLFPKIPEQTADPRECPLCKTGRLSLKLGKFGAFIGCSHYPTCSYTRPIAPLDGSEDDSNPSSIQTTIEPKVLGIDPMTQGNISIRKGPYGFYIQLDTVDVPPIKTKAKTKVVKPKRVSLPKGISPETCTLKDALGLLNLPRDVGVHPETEDMITASIGRFGPYLKHQSNFTSLKQDDDVLTIGLNRAVTLIAEAASKPKRPRKTFVKKTKSPVKKSIKKSRET